MPTLNYKQPDYHALDAPPEIKEMIHDSIYYNSGGNLQNSSQATIIQYSFSIFLIWVIGSGVVLFLLSIIGFDVAIIQIISSGLLGIILFYLFYKWGWNSYEEAWYHFDDRDELLTVVSRPQEEWEIIEIPYEQVDAVKWDGGKKGRAIIHAGGFEFPTNRAGTKRYSSVTELWGNLARIDTRMSGWPITLICPECNREFGHHIGTAQCPFDDVILIDPSTKGRIDPEDQHPQDLDRI